MNRSLLARDLVAANARHRGLWTPWEISVLRANIEKSDRQIAKLLMTKTYRAVASKRLRLGLKRNERKDFTRRERAIIRKLAPFGMRAIRKALPGHHNIVFYRHSRHFGFEIARDPVKMGRCELYNAIRRRAREDGITFRGLDRECRSGDYFLRDGLTAAPKMHFIRRAVRFFGGRISHGAIDWMDR